MKTILALALFGVVSIAAARMYSGPPPDYHCVEWGEEKMQVRTYQKWSLWYKARPCTKLAFEKKAEPEGPAP